MFGIKIQGLEKVTQHLDQLSQKARAIADEYKIPIPEGMTEEKKRLSKNG